MATQAVPRSQLTGQPTDGDTTYPLDPSRFEGNTSTTDDGTTYVNGLPNESSRPLTPATPAAPAGPADGARSTDPAYIQSVLSSWANLPGYDPILKTQSGIDYYTQRILETGGLGSDNTGYWQVKASTAVGQPEGGAAATASTPTTDPAVTALLQQIAAQGAAASQQNQQRDDQLWGELQGQITDAQQPVTASDPIIKPQVDAYRNEQTRSAQAGQAAQAESAAYRGTPTGTADGATAGAYENAGVNTGNFQASLIGNELTARRTQLQNMLTASAGVLSGDQTRAVQQEIASLTSQIQEQGLTQQNSQFYDTYADTLAQQGNTLDNLLMSQLLTA